MPIMVFGFFLLEIFSDKNFVQDNPDLKKRLDDELTRVTSQYGGTKPTDLEAFPKLTLNGILII